MKTKISQSIKYQAVREVLGGAGISAVARKYGVNRSSIYRWVELSRKAIRQSLKSHRRKTQDNQLARGKLERQLESLQRKLKKKAALVKELRRESRRKTGSDPRPARCPKCGCEKIYKNGLYLQPLSKVIPPEVYFAEKIPVKRFVCASCNNSINLDLPGILHHWLKRSSKHPDMSDSGSVSGSDRGSAGRED
ncbi:MAG: helix-turn-helix domain-containing protein [Candidatus Erginobacter occultus]|nr:helix-turn-helix domain-containing protein [Candidatus Erginobacter occultus]